MRKKNHTNILCEVLEKLTEEEIKKEIFLLDKFREDLLNDEIKADVFFQEIGIYNSEGKLTKEFGGKE